MSDPIQPIRQAVTVAAVASCDCNCKSPDPAMHHGYCRYLKLMAILDACDDAAARIDALEAEVARLRAVMVKPLEWCDYETDEGTQGQFANTSIGRYLCVPSGWFLVGQSGWNDANSLKAAKAAAQADYEARILSALTPQPDTPVAVGLSDWSGLPDVYVTSAKLVDGIFWEITACSVPMAIGPEVRLKVASQSDPQPDAHNAAIRAAAGVVSEEIERARNLGFPHVPVLSACQRAILALLRPEGGE